MVPDGKTLSHRILIKNVSIFNGESEELITGFDVITKGNKIEGLIPAGGGLGLEVEGYEKVIDGGGGFLTPGLIDVHWHSMMALPAAQLMSLDKVYITAVACADIKDVLLRGVTTIRDAAGDAAGIQKAIDQGYMLGPRMYTSGAILSQYSGHGDFRNPNYLPKEWGGPPSPSEITGLTITCNGKDQVLAATRHNLYCGATQIKMAISGGVISYGDPLYVEEFLPEEIEMACKAASDFGTYVFVHCHSTAATRRGIKAGVKSFDHISVIDEETVKMLAEANCFASVQPRTAWNIATTYPKGDPRQVKAQRAVDNTANVMTWAKKHGLTMGWGTDLLDTKEMRDEQLKDLTMRMGMGNFSCAELMIQATGNGGKTVALCGQRNPYGKLGVIEAGAMADILIYSKNPLEDITIIENHEENLKLIMKDGQVVKNII